MDDALLIAGCGYVGGILASESLSNFRSVLGLRRRVELLPSGVVPIAADLTSPGSLPEVPPLSALVYLPSAGERTETAYRRAYVDGVERLADALAARAEGLRRAIFVSSTAVYGTTEGEVDETTEAVPSGFTGTLLLEGERRFVARFPNAVVLRLAGIYGPGRGRMVREVIAGGPFESKAEAIGNRMHRDDCAGAIAHLLSIESPAPLYVGVDDAPVPLGEVRAFIATRLGLDANAFSPRGAATGKRLSNARLRASGYSLAFPTYREGYPAIVDEVAASH